MMMQVKKKMGRWPVQSPYDIQSRTIEQKAFDEHVLRADQSPDGCPEVN